MNSAERNKRIEDLEAKIAAAIALAESLPGTPWPLTREDLRGRFLAILAPSHAPLYAPECLNEPGASK